MTIILPENYHAQSILEANRVTCIRREEAIRQDIRPMRIGFLQVMQTDMHDELNLLHPLGLSIIQVDPVWIKLRASESLGKNEIPEFYVFYEDASQEQALDGLIVHGTILETSPLDHIPGWQEICRLLSHAKANCPSTMGIGGGAMVLANLEGIACAPLRQRQVGVYELRNIYHYHPITGELDDTFCCPQNCRMGIEDSVMEHAKAEGRLNLLGYGRESGYVIFETPDHRFVMHTGHPEYSAQRLLCEAKRNDNRTGFHVSTGLEMDPMMNRWRGHRYSFFTSWLKYCYLQVSMNS